MERFSKSQVSQKDKTIGVSKMQWGNEVTEILDCSVEGFIVKVKFKNGVIAKISLGHIFSKPKNLTAEILRGHMFEKCFLESGALAWPNGFEISPDALLSWYRNQKKKTIKAA